MTLSARALRVFSAGLLAATFAVAPLAASANVIIYDAITGLSFGDTAAGTTNRQLEADAIQPLSAPVGLQWRVNRIDVVLSVFGVQDQEVALFLGLFDGVNTSAVAPASIFSNPVAALPTAPNTDAGPGFILGRVTTTTPNAFTRVLASVSFTPQDNVLLNSTTVGISTIWGVRAPNTTGQFSVANSNFGTSLALSAPVVGASANGFYRDVNFDLAFQGSELRQISGVAATNLAVRISATAVPEPGTIAGIGMALAGLVAVRRRKA